MTRGRGRKITEGGRSLTLGEREDLKGLRQEAEATLKHLSANPGTSRSDSIDKAKLKQEIDYYDGVLAEHSPTTPRGANKDKLWTRAKELEEQMKANMPTREEMDHPARRPGAVRKHMMWAKVNDPKVREYKELMRRLEPDDPTAMDVERLRREK